MCCWSSAQQLQTWMEQLMLSPDELRRHARDQRDQRILEFVAETSRRKWEEKRLLYWQKRRLDAKHEPPSP